MIGAGAVLATASLDPSEVETGERIDRQVEFDAAVALVVGTQYHLLFSSAASATKPWRIERFPSNSGTAFVSGTTSADVSGATFGGATDNYDRVGSPALTPDGVFDAPYAILAAPDAPANVTLTVEPAVAVVDPDRPSARADTQTPTVVPPRTVVEWDPTSLTTDFRAYRVYRRLRGQPAFPWAVVAEVDVPTGYDATTVEAQHTAFVDYEGGWAVAGSAWADGWEYAVTVIEDATGLESLLASATTPAFADPEGTYDSWLTSNAAPYLLTPLRTEDSRSATPADEIQVDRPLGRNDAVALVPAGVPLTRYRFRWRNLGHLSEYRTRQAWAAALGGRQMALLDCRGDRALGVITPPTVSHGSTPMLEADASLVVTGRDSEPANYNRPAGLVLDGSADTITHDDHADLDPGTDPFSIFMAAWFGSDGLSDYHFAKGDMATNGWSLRSTGAAGTLQMFLRGAGGNGGPSYSGDWYDGDLHVAVGTSDAAAQALYEDGALRATASVAHGSISNAVDVSVGSQNGGASDFAVESPVMAWGYYPAVLTADEVTRLTAYLLGYFDRAPTAPPGASLFVDLRDERCWDGIADSVVDLSGTATSEPSSATPDARPPLAARGAHSPTRLRWLGASRPTTTPRPRSTRA